MAMANTMTSTLHGPIVPSSLSLAAVVVPSILAPLAIVAVSVRFYAQRHSKHGISADDYAFFGALVFTVGISVLCIYGALMAGLGWPVEQLLNGPYAVAYWKELFAGLALWGASLTLIRAGLLLFYRRIFSTSSRTVNTVLLIFNACWFISLLIGMFVKFRWIPDGRNIAGYPIWLISYAVIDVAQDLVTASIPLFVIRSLNMKLKRKLLLSGIFLLGIFCIFSSLIRMKYIVQLKQLHNDLPSYIHVTYDLCIWSVIQPCVSLTTSCLPAYAPLFSKGRRLNKIVSKIFSLVTFRSRRQKKPGEKGNGGRHDFSISKTVTWTVRHNASQEELPKARDRSHVEMTSLYGDSGSSAFSGGR